MRRIWMFLRKLGYRLRGKPVEDLDTWLILYMKEGRDIVDSVIVGECDGTREEAMDCASQAVVNYQWRNGDFAKGVENGVLMIMGQYTVVRKSLVFKKDLPKAEVVS